LRSVVVRAGDPGRAADRVLPRADQGADDQPGAGDPDTQFLPLDPDLVDRAVTDYQARTAAGGTAVQLSAETDGRTVTVTCRRTVRVPFGRLLGYGDGLERISVAHARSPLD
jgi:hypothetical protein